MSAAVLVTHRLAPRAGRDLASGIFALPLELASGLSRSEPANDTGENGVAYDEVTSESCYWTSKDPIRFAGGANLYAYADNDPVNRIDEDGLQPKECFDRCQEKWGSDYKFCHRNCEGVGGPTEDSCDLMTDAEVKECKKKCDDRYEKEVRECAIECGRNP